MTRAVLIANIGHSDLQVVRDVPEWELATGGLDTNRVADIGRRLAQASSQQLKKWGSPFVWPILTAYMEWAASQGVHYEELVLFGTSQPEDPEFSAGDTYPLVEALRKHSSLFGFPPVYPIKVEGNPSDFTDTFISYEKSLKSLSQRWERKSVVPEVYVALTGGTPQMNLALLVRAVDVLAPRHRVEGIYAFRNGPVRKVPALHRVRKEQEYQGLVALVRTFQYRYVADRFADSGQPLERAIHCLATYGHARYNSDWQGALRALYAADEVTDTLVDVRSAIGRWMRQIRRLQEVDNSREPAPWLRELVWQAEVAWDQGTWWAVLVRIAAFRENSLKVLANHMGARYSDTGRRLDPRWIPEDLQQVAGARNIDLYRDLNHHILEVVCEYLVERVRPDCRAVLAALQVLGPLVNLRNKTAHEGAAINRDRCLQGLREGLKSHQAGAIYFELPSTTEEQDPEATALFQGLQRVAADITGDTGRNDLSQPRISPYRDLNDQLEGLLDQWRSS